MRGWVSSVANYSEPVPIGGVMRSFTVGRIAASRHPDFSRGDFVTGLFGWQDYAAVDGVRGPAPDHGHRPARFDGARRTRAERTHRLLRAPGTGPAESRTKRSRSRRRQVRSGRASGRSRRSRDAAPSASPAARRRSHCAATNSATTSPSTIGRTTWMQAIADACPDGIDVYFDNTAGEISDAVLKNLARRRPRDHLRHRVHLELEPRTLGAESGTTPASEAGTHAGLPHLRLCRPVRGGLARS